MIRVGDIYTNNAGLTAIVTEYLNANNVYVEFESGGVCRTTSQHLRSGQFKDPCQPTHCGVGFIGNGPYTTRNSLYNPWRRILSRVYETKNSKLSMDPHLHNYQNWCEMILSKAELNEGDTFTLFLSDNYVTAETINIVIL